jgi:hypothetical protein
MTLALLTFGEFFFMPPICLAIALVTTAAHREDMSTFLPRALRAWLVLMVGILVFMIVQSYLFEWLLPS